MMKLLSAGLIFFGIFLIETAGFASGGFLGEQDMGGFSGRHAEETLESCFRLPDPGARSGCLIDIAVKETDVSDCDLIEIPGMVHDCIDRVAAVTTIAAEKCRIMNEQYRDHCQRAVRR